MLKVFLVEDEIVMREGIKNNINWESEGFTFVGEASDGELAYPLIQKTKPDILITDIKMPFMDGLELSRLVKSEMPGIKIIILSGYDEFEYAKEAISIGITDYLVKPIAGAKLLEAVKQVGKTIAEEQEKEKFYEAYQKEQNENKYLERQKLFREMISGKASMSEMIDAGKKLDMDLSAEAYNVILFYAKTDAETENGEYSERLVEIADALETYQTGRKEIQMFEQTGGDWIFLVMARDGADINQVINESLNHIVAIVMEYPGVTYFAGVGTIVNRLRELNKSYDEANRAYAYRYLAQKNRIIYADKIAEIGNSKEDVIDLNSLDIGKMDRRIVENFLRTGSMGEVKHFVDEYFASLGEDNINSMLFRQYIVMDMYFCTVSLLESLKISSERVTEICGEFHDVAGILNSVKDTKEYLYEIMTEAIHLRDMASEKKYNGLIMTAKEFIYKNYDKEDISLNSVAASVNISPNHFSSIFSQEAGKTFIEFLTEVRMEKAKELLRCSGMKSSEIGYAVGYKDPHYFSYIFKKTQDMTPKEFRLQGKSINETNN